MCVPGLSGLYRPDISAPFSARLAHYALSRRTAPASKIRRIAGRRIPVQGRIVRVDPDTVTCGGLGGAARVVRGNEAWSRFRCVQPTFPAGAVAGSDAIFFVEPRDSGSVELTGSRFTRY
jgi:hypothetical protein